MSFAWLFAIIVGAVILFIAIYATVHFIEVAQHKQNTETAMILSILLDPFETGVANVVGDVIKFNRETRTYYSCSKPNAVDTFGKQTISSSEESGFGKRWAEPGGAITIRNKFIFAENMEQGKKLYIFSKPFFMGFKVSDIIMISSENYCFVAPPNVIEEEIGELNSLKNINVTNTLEFCPEESIKVCFSFYTGECDINVEADESFQAGYVTKEGTNGQETLPFVGSLVYAAIFSSPEIYECNVQRLGAKTAALAKVYKDKIELVKTKNCNSIIGPYLDAIISAFSESDLDISDIKLAETYAIAQQMDDENEDALCRIYPGEDY